MNIVVKATRTQCEVSCKQDTFYINMILYIDPYYLLGDILNARATDTLYRKNKRDY